MKLKRSLHWLFEKKLFKLFFFYLLILSLGFLVQLILHTSPMNILKIEEQSAGDLSLNDLHYSINADTKQFITDSNIVLINTGDLSTDSFRLQLSQLVELLNFCDASVIGIDHTITADASKVGTKELIQVLRKNPNVVLALDTSEHNVITINGSSYGTVSLMNDPYTVRKYEGGEGSFAAKIARKYRKNVEIPSSDFYINYVSTDFEQIEFSLNSRTRFLKHTTLPLYNALDVINGLEPKLIEGKIVVIGHFGSTALRDIRNDNEDKFPVPSDPSLLYRGQTMPGVLIHVNAVQNILRKEIQFVDVSAKWWFRLLSLAMLFGFLYFLVFIHMSKAINILVLFLLTIPMMYFTLLAMQYNWYIEMGGTLLQLLILEEVVEIFSPLYTRIQNRLKLKSS